jgi:hypothetical protein
MEKSCKMGLLLIGTSVQDLNFKVYNFLLLEYNNLIA